MSWLFPEAEPFSLVAADPPWSYDNFGQRDHGAAKAVYDELPDAAIAALPVEGIAARNAVCALWVTRTVIAEGRHVPVLKAWGFRPGTTGFCWVKTYADGSPYCGLGNYTRGGAEWVVFGFRGSCPRAEEATAVLEVLTAPVEKRPVGEDEHLERHSSKPELVLERLEALWPHYTRRVELFARRRRPGWCAWGAEAPSCDLVFGPEVGAIWTPPGAVVATPELTPAAPAASLFGECA